MKPTKGYLTLFLAITSIVLVVLLVFPPHRVVLVVDQLPPNTPAGAPVFIAGNFNYWDPGDGSFQLERDGEGRYFIELPLGWGKIEYKFTRGDWTTSEADACGHPIEKRNRSSWGIKEAFFTSQVVNHRIFSWEDLGPTDCDKVVIRVKNLPKETPPNEPVYIAGSFNDWNPRKPSYVLKKSPRGFYYVEVTRYDDEVEFKFARGSWDKEEVDNNGDRLPNRKFRFGAHDTLDLEISGWLDIKSGMDERDVSFLVSTPFGTPPDDPLFIVGNFNRWKPADPKYEMKRLGPNLFFIRMRKPAGDMEYKFTRGPWGKEEVDVFGNHISNRKLKTSADTLRISIPEWVDIPVDQTFTLKRDEINLMMNSKKITVFPPTEGVKNVFFNIKNSSEEVITLYLRMSLPSAPNNRNYGFVTKLEPGGDYPFVCPAGTNIYTCSGKYWGDFRPKECLVLPVDDSKDGVTLDAWWLIWKENCKVIKMNTLPNIPKDQIPKEIANDVGPAKKP